MPPAAIPSMIEGTTLAPADRTVDTKSLVVWGVRSPLTLIVVASCVEYQNGETWRSMRPLVDKLCWASGSAKYGAQASMGMSIGGGGGGS